MNAFGVASDALKTRRVIIPESVKEIMSYGLEDLEVSDYIVVPKTVTAIGDHSFNLGEHAYIKCEPGSYAYKYCVKHDLRNSVDGIPTRASKTSTNYDFWKDLMGEDF